MSKPLLNHFQAFEMNALVYCQDNVFLPTLNRILTRLGLITDVTADYDYAQGLITEKKIDAVVIDWQEVINMGEFLESIRKSKLNQETVQVVIARDLMDMRQAFSAGVQFLIHKPASVVQINGCLEAMQGAVLRNRRKGHREPVRVLANLSIRNSPLLGAMIINISNQGLGLLLNNRTCKGSAELSAGSEIEFSFTLPETKQIVTGVGVVTWINRDGSAGVQFRETNAGVQFQCLSEADKQNIESWVGERFERTVAKLRQSLRVG